MSFQFVNVVSPAQGISAESRSHVMQDYLRKKRSKPDEASKLQASSERNRKQSQATRMKQQKAAIPGCSISTEDRRTSNAAPRNVSMDLAEPFSTLETLNGLNSASCSPSSDISHGSTHKQNHNNRHFYAMTALGDSYQTTQATAAMRNGTIEAYLLGLMAAFSKLGPQRCIGSEIDPFHTLPQLSSPLINIERLKKHCSMFFGSVALGRLWVPTILKARHSFLSCMCLGALHHDIMNGSQQDGPTTLALKVAVIQEINENLAVPWSEVSQVTVIAILHLLAAEVVNGSETTLRTHLKGLGMILDQYGGLGALGLDGLIANILSIMVYFAWILRGVTPPRDFINPFPYHHRQPFTIAESIPESPLYCPRLGFFTVIRDKRCSPQVYDLLCDMRDLTCELVDLDLVGPREKSEVFNPTAVSTFAQVVSLPSANIPGTAVSGNWVYESCRLAAYIYCYQLRKSTVNDDIDVSSLIAVVHDLQSALTKSDTSDCWGDMAGVLFWCALVGGRCMHDVLPKLEISSALLERRLNDMHVQRNEYCRKWLTLLAVRIGVVLGFPYPDAICITLRRFIHVRDAAVG